MRREPLDFELRAAVDFAELDRSYGRTAAAVEDLLTQEMLPRQVEAIVRQILFTRQGDPRQRITPATMATLRAPVEGLVQLEEHLFDVAQTGAAEAVAEAAAQGVDLPLPDDATLRRLVADQAEAVAQQVADGMSLAASRRAVQIAPGRTPDEVAREVDAYLHGLEHRWERDQLRGAVQAAQVGGRMHTWEAVPEEQPTHYHSSELLDARTCPPCATEDGRQYPDLRTARRAYPSGGFLSCEGGPRCRGTIVAVFDEAP